jgi:SAM-dependent methyltransferase
MPETTQWPKTLPQLSASQEQIRDDFMRYWHEVLPNRYSIVERFNHGYAASSELAHGTTLEIGAGLGEHLEFEQRHDEEYCAVELRQEMANAIKRRYPRVQTIVGDCQQTLPLEDASFDRALAIHVLEHLPNLPAAVAELHRVLKPDGKLVAVIPCEGGLAYSLARRISAQRIFERRYKVSYDWFVRSEHINVPSEIVAELAKLFDISARQFFPLRVPLVTANIAIGLTLRPTGSGPAR